MIEFSRLKAISLLSLVIAGLAVAVSLLNSHHPIDVSDLWPVLLRWALATKTYILLLSSHTIAFLLGGLFFLLAALIGTVIYITWLPYYFFPLKKTAVDRSRSSNPPLSRTRKQSLRDDSDADPQLFKKGWIRFSLYIQDQADPSFLEPFDTPTYLQQSQDESLMPPDSQSNNV